MRETHLYLGGLDPTKVITMARPIIVALATTLLISHGCTSDTPTSSDTGGDVAQSTGDSASNGDSATPSDGFMADGGVFGDGTGDSSGDSDAPGDANNPGDNQGGDSFTPPPIDTSKLIPSCFVADANNPIISSGDYFTGSSWNDPDVIKVANGYVMFASSSLNFDGNVKTYRFTSADALSWTLDPTTPVFEKSADGWDKKSIETPSVIFFKNEFHLFYTGYPASLLDPGSFNIGHATSDDGITWIRDLAPVVVPNDPYASVNLEFNQFLVAEPAAVVFNDSIYLYFTAMGANLTVNKTWQVIGLATSTDGDSWTSPIEVLLPDLSIYPRETYRGYSTPNAIILDDQVHLFFDVYEDGETASGAQVKLHHAYSANGTSGWVQDATEIFDHADFTWTADEIRAPAPLLIGDTLYYWFAGHSDFTLGIGLATCDLAQ